MVGLEGVRVEYAMTETADGHGRLELVRSSRPVGPGLRRDYIWRKKINAMLGKRMSLEEIAENLNAKKVPTIHGTNRWTAASVRKAFVS